MAEHQIVDLAVEGSNPSSHPNCPLSGHSSRLLQDIVHRPPPSEWLVVSIWVDSQSPQELSVFRDDADVGSCDEEAYLAVPVRVADRDVTQPTEVAQRDSSESVDLVSVETAARRGSLLETACVRSA